MRIAVVDDNEIERTLVNNFLTLYKKDRMISFDVAQFESGTDFIASLDKGVEYDIVFMDIYMTDMNGIEVGRVLRGKDSDCLLIFLTSSVEFMPEAFSCHAFEYVVKPATKERVFSVLTDAISFLPEKTEIIELAAGTGKDKICLPLGEFLYAEVDGHYIDIISTDGEEYRIRTTFSDFCAQCELYSSLLVINKGMMVNLDHVKNIDNGMCEMDNGTNFFTKVRDYARIRQRWQEYIIEKMHR